MNYRFINTSTIIIKRVLIKIINVYNCLVIKIISNYNKLT